MDSLVDEDEGKMGKRFMSVDELEAVDIGDGDKPRDLYVSAKLDLEYKQELIALLEEYKDCFAWEYYEIPGLDRKLVEHQLQIKPRYISLSNKLQEGLNQKLWPMSKQKLLSYTKRNLLLGSDSTFSTLERH